MVRQAGRSVESRTQVLPRSSEAAGHAALLTAPGGPTSDDPRYASGSRLTPAFGIPVGGRRRPVHDVPAFGTPEHSRLLTGSLDLTAIECAAQTGPLVGFAPVVLDPRGPGAGEPAPATAATRVLPTRRSLRAATGSALGRPLAEGVLPGSGLPAPRGRSAHGVTVLRPLTGSPATTGALRVRDVEEALAAAHAVPRVPEDPTPTGELARPFVDETVLTAWSDLEDVPPPVSVDVFQRPVRAGLAIDDTESLKALDDETAAGARRSARSGRSRREVRARERAATSTRSVAARRLAKGGVLAITALGVVSSATPQGLDALGLNKDGASTRNTVDFASALAPDISAPVLTEGQLQQVRRTTLSGHLRTELSDVQASDAVHAGMQAGGTLAELAKQQDDEVLAERQAAHQRAVRDAISNPQGYARTLLAEQGLPASQFQCLDSLWKRESGWNYRASNASSGAYGIAQALPGSKMNVVGSDWRTNPVTQIKWGLNYISDRYGTPCGAWAHSQATGWY